MGHEDTYKINLGTKEMSIALGAKTATCSSVEGGDPKWSGYMQGVGNPLVNILENDKIYPPTVFIAALEGAWTAWRNGTLDDQKVQQEVQELFKWGNAIWKSKPQSDFWSSIF
jgi:hypothetical protein